MKISNPFHMNNWEIKKFLRVILSLQLALWGIIGLDLLGFQIFFLRQFIGFIYLTFVPGIIIIRILKLHELSAIKFLVYSVGLSLSTSMFIGFFISTIFPLWGISSPLSLWPLVLAISCVVMILSIFAYIRDRSFYSPEYILFSEIISPPVIILTLLPLGMIGGTYLINFSHNNSLQMIILLLVAVVAVGILCTKFISEKYYPFAIYTCAVTLLYHSALISPYIWGWDIQAEYYITNNVLQNGFWDPTISSVLNAMLSLVMVSPIYSIILNLGLDWIFKVIYPLLFAFVPVGLYEIFRIQIDDKIAFLSCFYFISLTTFYTEMLIVARQQIAELFFVLILLSMIDQNLDKNLKTVFFLIFGISLIVSHYGLSYLFLLILLIAWIIGRLEYHISFREKAVHFFSWLQAKMRPLMRINLEMYPVRLNYIPFLSIVLYFLVLLSWYIYTAGSSAFIAIIAIGDNIVINIFSEFLNPESTEGLAIIFVKTYPFFHNVVRYLDLLTIFFIIIGFMMSLVWHKWVRFDTRYLLLSFGALSICLGGVLIPYFASALNTTRLFQISLILLAPFCVLGGITVIRAMSRVIRIRWSKSCVNNSLKILSVFFAIFLLFSVGWVEEFTVSNIRLVKQTSEEHPSAFLNYASDYPIFNEREVTGAKWLTDVKGNEIIYADDYRSLLFLRFTLGKNIKIFPTDAYKTLENSYIYLGSFNLRKETILATSGNETSPKQEYVNTREMLTNFSKIYSNHDSAVYYW